MTYFNRGIILNKLPGHKKSEFITSYEDSTSILAKYIHSQLAKGFSIPKIKETLLDIGWSQQQIDSVFKPKN